MKGYYEGYSYVLIMPDGRKLRIATDGEAKDYIEEVDNGLQFEIEYCNKNADKKRINKEKNKLNSEIDYI